MKRLIEDLGPFVKLMAHHGGWLGLGTLLGFVAVAAAAGLLGLAGWFIIAAALAGMTPETAHLFNFFLPSIGVRLLAMARTAARYGERVFAHDAVFRLLKSLRIWFYRRVEPLAPACFQAYRTGDLLSRIVSDIDLMDNLYLRMIAPCVVVVLLALVTGAVLGQFHGGIALLASLALLLAAAGLVLLSAIRGGRISHRLHGALTTLRIHLVEQLQGLADVLSFRGAPKLQTDLTELEGRLVARQAQLSRLSALTAALATLAVGVTVTVVLYWAVQLVAAGALAGPVLGVMVLGVLATFEAVMPLPGAFQALGQTRDAARRLLVLTRQAPAVTFPATSAIRRQSAPTNAIAFQNICFRYGPHEPWALHNIDLTIPHGTHLAVMGPTGAGKSTLLYLLARFWDPSHGTILVDGRDIRTIAEDDLRTLVAVVPQQPHFFNASLRENLMLAKPRTPEETLWEALDRVHLKSFVAGLPNGLDTWIGEGGQLISGGQARRLALARAVLREAPLWILDEPTEGLDPDTERAVLGTLNELTRGKTVLMITHRIAGLADMDQVVWLESGAIAAHGPPDRLRQDFAPYTALFHHLR